MGVLVSSDTHQGQLMQVVTRVGSTREAEIYQLLIKQDQPKCPHCGCDLKPAMNDMQLVIYNPLQSLFGMEVGKPITVCQECKKEIEMPANVDLTAFPSTVVFLRSLREEYKKRALAARSTKAIKKRGTTDG